MTSGEGRPWGVSLSHRRSRLGPTLLLLLASACWADGGRDPPAPTHSVKLRVYLERLPAPPVGHRALGASLSDRDLLEFTARSLDALVEAGLEEAHVAELEAATDLLDMALDRLLEEGRIHPLSSSAFLAWAKSLRSSRRQDVHVARSAVIDVFRRTVRSHRSLWRLLIADGPRRDSPLIRSLLGGPRDVLLSLVQVLSEWFLLSLVLFRLLYSVAPERLARPYRQFLLAVGKLPALGPLLLVPVVLILTGSNLPAPGYFYALVLVLLSHAELPEDRSRPDGLWGRGPPTRLPDEEATNTGIHAPIQRIHASLPEGRYGPPSLLGRGGMGAVYKLMDFELGREVALKVIDLDPGSGGKTARARFGRETRALASLAHPGLCVIHEVGDRPAPHFIMEFVDGRSLKDVFKERGPLPPDQVRSWMMEAASALAHAHERGVIHRDIKPGNLMLDRTGRLRVIDFGLAFLEEETRLTEVGLGLGTVGFAPPEQILGERTGPSSDVYSLAATGYFLLTGRLPYTIPQLAVGEGFQPQPLPVSVPVQLAQLLVRCLQMKTGDRPGSMLELIERLGAPT